MAAKSSAGFDQLTFVIPVRIDTEDRMWNLATVLRFIECRMPGCEVIVVEQDGASKLTDLLAGHRSVRHLFIEDGDWFRKSNCVNRGAQMSDRRFICMYDTDVLLEPEAIRESLVALDRGGWRLVLPFNRIFVDVRGELRRNVGESLQLMLLGRLTSMRQGKAIADATVRFVEGGIFIADRETFLAEGGLNSKMKSYGWEDTEMHKRFLKLGYPIMHLPQYSLVHLDHARGVDSRPNEHYESNKAEFLKVIAMKRSALRSYVESELSVTARNQRERLAQLRSSAQGGRRFLMSLQAFMILAKVQIQAHGFISLLRARLGLV